MTNSTNATPYNPSPLLVSSSIFTSAQLVEQFEDFRNNLRIITIAPELVFERLVGNLNDVFSAAINLEKQQHDRDLKNLESSHQEFQKNYEGLERKCQELIVSLDACKLSHTGFNKPPSDIKATSATTPTPAPTTVAVRTKHNPRIGSFHTSEIRYWFQIRAETSKQISFGRPYPRPPGLPIGLTALDVAPNANVRVKSYTTNTQTDRFEMHIDSWFDTALRGAGCSWLEIESDDPDFQFGSYNTAGDSSPDICKVHITREIKFQRSYASPPVVVVWLTALDTNQVGNCRVKTYAEEVTATGFQIHVETWGDSKMHSAVSSWVAYTAGLPGVLSGSFSTLDLRSSNCQQAENAGYEAFAGGVFMAPPRVMLAINSLDVDHRWGLGGVRLAVKTSLVSALGMKWHLDAWMGASICSAGASYIAMT